MNVRFIIPAIYLLILSNCSRSAQYFLKYFAREANVCLPYWSWNLGGATTHRRSSSPVSEWVILKVTIAILVIARVTGPNVTKFINNIHKSLSFNALKLELWWSNVLRNASATNEGGEAILPQTWLPWKSPLSNQKKKVRTLIYDHIRIMWSKLGGNFSSRYWYNLSQKYYFKNIEKLMQSEHLACCISMASWLKKAIS